MSNLYRGGAAAHPFAHFNESGRTYISPLEHSGLIYALEQYSSIGTIKDDRGCHM